MLVVEVSIMLVQILRSSFFRPAAIFLVAVAASACNAIETPSAGELVVVPRGPDDECVTVPGRLRLDGMQAGSATVSGVELCGNPVVRRELPAGLYSASWQPESDPDAAAASDVWELRDPAIINVLPGQITILRVRQIDSDAQLLSRAR